MSTDSPTPPTPPSPPNRYPDLKAASPSPDFVALIPFDLAWRHRICAVVLDDARDLLVTVGQPPLDVVARITERLPKFVEVVEASEAEVIDLIGRAYERPRST